MTTAGTNNQPAGPGAHGGAPARTIREDQP